MGTACEASNGLGSVLRPLLRFDQLAVAGSALEGREARRVEDALPPAPRELAAATGGRERSRGADDAADQKGARTPEPIVAVHGTIVFPGRLFLGRLCRCSSQLSAT